MANDRPTSTASKLLLGIGCLGVLLFCCGLPVGGYALLKGGVIDAWIMSSFESEHASRLQARNEKLTAIADNAALTDEEAIEQLARAIFNTEETMWYEGVESVEVSGEPPARAVRIVALQNIEMDAEWYEQRGERPDMASALARITRGQVGEDIALLAALGQRRGLGSIELLLRAGVHDGGNKEYIDAFEVAIPSENFAALADGLGQQALQRPNIIPDEEQMEGVWVIQQDNFDQITVEIRPK